MIKLCKICGEAFVANGPALCCSQECRRENKMERKRKYRQENREKFRESSRKYRQENREKIRERRRKYRQENPEKLRERERKYYQENPDKFRERMRKYRQENPEKIRESALNQYYRKTGKSCDALFFQTMQFRTAIADASEQNK